MCRITYSTLGIIRVQNISWENFYSISEVCKYTLYMKYVKLVCIIFK